MCCYDYLLSKRYKIQKITYGLEIINLIICLINIGIYSAFLIDKNLYNLSRLSFKTQFISLLVFLIFLSIEEYIEFQCTDSKIITKLIFLTVINLIFFIMLIVILFLLMVFNISVNFNLLILNGIIILFFGLIYALLNAYLFFKQQTST